MESKGFKLYKVEPDLPKKKVKKKRVASFNFSQLPFDTALKKLEKKQPIG